MRESLTQKAPSALGIDPRRSSRKPRRWAGERSDSSGEEPVIRTMIETMRPGEPKGPTAGPAAKAAIPIQRLVRERGVPAMPETSWRPTRRESSSPRERTEPPLGQGGLAHNMGPPRRRFRSQPQVLTPGDVWNAPVAQRRRLTPVSGDLSTRSLPGRLRGGQIRQNYSPRAQSPSPLGGAGLEEEEQHQEQPPIPPAQEPEGLLVEDAHMVAAAEEGGEDPIVDPEGSVAQSESETVVPLGDEEEAVYPYGEGEDMEIGGEGEEGNPEDEEPSDSEGETRDEELRRWKMKIVPGDLLLSKADYIVQQCNCKSAGWGCGFSREDSREVPACCIFAGIQEAPE